MTTARETQPALDGGAAPDRVPFAWRATLGLLNRLPQAALSRGFGRLAVARLPRRLRRPVLGAFARAAGIDVAEAELPLEAYGSLDEFFVRRLRPDARRWPDDPDVLASPVDGIAGPAGRIHDGRLLQAKGRSYSAAELLDDAETWTRYRDGVFLTIYLSPRHYHRIHAPCAGEVREARHVPGGLLPVNPPAAAHVPDLFARNERLIAYVDGPLGRVAVVAVGAFNVGRIAAAFDPGWNAPPRGRRRRGPAGVTNRKGARAETRRYVDAVRVRQGDELMAFHLGSTVVVLVEPGRVELEHALRPGEELRMGRPIARRSGAAVTGA